MTKLSASTLEQIPQKIPRPQYNLDDVSTGILHFGVGGFHRSHMAMALNSLMNHGEALDWGICGVGLLPHDQRLRDVFRTQDCLYTLVLKNSDGTRTTEVIGSIREYLYAPDNPEAVLQKLADPSTKIVSLTITEGGYNFDRVTGEFDFTNSDVQYDLKHPDSPKTVFGYITEGLRRRRNAGTAPFTVLSCDNIQGNGHVAKDMFSAFARAQDPELGEWISQNVAFPNSMVDRITPVTTDEDIAEVEALIGMTDAWPVVAEPYFQWVVEDTFTVGRPPFEHANVQMVQDVMPYELMKLRLLNASHQGLCYFGYLSGYRYAHEAMQDPAISTFLREYMDKEATPTLLPVPGIDLTAYKDKLIERFSNPEVKDTLARLCAESSDRIPKWLVPVIQEQLDHNRDVTLSAAIVASWARYAEAVDEQGNPINVVDPLKDELIPIAKSQRENSLAFIQNQKLFGTLSDDKKFAHAYVDALNSLHSRGARETVLSLT